MSRISRSKKKASVKTLAITACLCLMIPTTLLAENSSPNWSAKEEAELRTQDRNANACNEARSQIREAEKAIGDACKDAKLGSISSCIAKSEKCAKTLGEETYSTTDALATIMGLPAGAKVSGACPQMNSQDYFDEKKRLQDEIKDLEKDIADLGDDKADAQKEFDEAMQDLQEGLTEAQQELEEQKLKIGEEEREQLAEFQSNQAAAKEQLRKKGSELLSLRGALTQAIRKKTTKMLELTSETSKFTCTAEYRKAADAFGKTVTGSNSHHMKLARQKKAIAIDAFNKCMNRFLQARLQLNEESKIEQENITKQIADTEASVDDINDSLNLASSQLDEMKVALKTRKSNAEKKVTDLIILNQQKMNSAQQNLKTKMDTLATRQSSLNAAWTRANNDLLTLGPAPARGAASTSAEASSTISTQTGIIENLLAEDEKRIEKCDLKSVTLAAITESKSKRSTSSTNARGRR